MGGAFTIVQQGRHHGYDGVGVLGFSPLRTQPPTGRARRRSRCPGSHATPSCPRGSSPTRRHWPISPAPAPARRRRATTTSWHGDSTTTTSTRSWCSGTWTTTRPATATCLRGRRPPSRHGGPLVPGPRLHPGRGRGHPLPRPGCAGRARRARRPPRRAARLRVVAERRLLRMPAHGAHAQLRGHPGVVLAAHRDVGRLGAGTGPERARPDGGPTSAIPGTGTRLRSPPCRRRPRRGA